MDLNMDLLKPFQDLYLIHPRKGLSSYPPSCHMMDLVVHEINNILCYNHNFRRASPSYHPYILRLYFGVLFWIQCLRAGLDVGVLDMNQRQFLNYFLWCYPPETLPIPGPLLPLFQTLCSSQLELDNFGKVYPRLPSHPGPSKRSEFMREGVEHFFLPNVPGILALLSDLFNSGRETGVHPRLGGHVPVPDGTNTNTIFGHHNFPSVNARTDLENWFLVSPGLQYPCEADQSLNEYFVEQFYDHYDFPVTSDDDDLRQLDEFLGMSRGLAWFSQVKDVAAIASSFFVDSGTLADCAPSGMAYNQVRVRYMDTNVDVPVPRCSADRRSLYTPSFYLETSARQLPDFAVATAAFAQTNICASSNHPMANLD